MIVRSRWRRFLDSVQRFEAAWCYGMGLIREDHPAYQRWLR